MDYYTVARCGGIGHPGTVYCRAHRLFLSLFSTDEEPSASVL